MNRAAAYLINQIRNHALLDIDLGHDGIVFERLCRRTWPFSPDERIRIAQAARGIVIAFNSFFAGILSNYGGKDADLPWIETPDCGTGTTPPASPTPAEPSAQTLGEE